VEAALDRAKLYFFDLETGVAIGGGVEDGARS
jgi:hypothetical protein